MPVVHQKMVPLDEVLRKTKEDLFGLYRALPHNKEELRKKWEYVSTEAKNHFRDYPMVWASYGIATVAVGAVAIYTRSSLIRAEARLRMAEDRALKTMAAAQRQQQASSTSASSGVTQGSAAVSHEKAIQEHLKRLQEQFPDVKIAARSDTGEATAKK